MGSRARRSTPPAAGLVPSAAWLAGVARATRARRGERRLTVAVDAAAYWEPLTGIGGYLDALLRHLAPRDDLRLRLYGERMIDGPWAPPPAAPLPEGPAIEEVRYPLPAGSVLASKALHPVLARLRALLIAADGNRVLFAPNYFLPRRFALALAAETPLVATVHDLGYRKVPWAIRPETLAELQRNLDFVWTRARAVLTDSEAVRREILEAGLAGPERLRCVPLAPVLQGTVRTGRPPDGTPERFGLFVGTVEPRKNLGTLLEAWRRLRRHLPEPPALVVCGPIGWAGDELLEELRRAADEGWLVRFGYVGSDRLAALYRGATALLLPSWYEGFGLPALEAAALGTPVLASDLPVLREVLGDAALFAPPDRPEAWAARLEELFADEALRGDLGRRGAAQARAFSWERAAEATARAFRAVAAEAGR